MQNIINLHEGALNAIDSADYGGLSDLLLATSEEGMNACNRGYVHFYIGEALNNIEEYLKATKYWKKWISLIEKDAEGLVKFSDLAWWNLQIADITKIKLNQSTTSFYEISENYCKKAIEESIAAKDYKVQIFHNLLLAHIRLQSGRIDEYSKTISGLFVIDVRDVKPSLFYEIKALSDLSIILQCEKGEPNEIVKYLNRAKKEHTLYLHKFRCQNTIRLVEDCLK